MKSTVSSLLVVLFASVSVYGQQDCTSILRLAQTTYEQGRLHELEARLTSNKCLTATDGTGFTKQEKVTAYRYLTLAYIYLEEPEKADQAMLNLLKTDSFFEINPAVDPAEFIALYTKFRVGQLFRVGIKLGPNITFPGVIQNYSTGATGGSGKYGIRPNFQFGLVFEKDFLRKDLPGFIKKLSIAPQLFYTGRSFNYNNPSLSNDGTGKDGTTGKPVTTSTYISKQGWLDLNLLGQYQISERGNFSTFVGFGPGFNYLLAAKYDQPQTLQTSGGGKTGPPIDSKTSFHSLGISLIAMAGLKIKLGGFYLTGDIRYQYGLNNVVNPLTRNNSDALGNYGIIPDDYRMGNFIANIGFVVPYFKPKKLYK